MMILPDDEDLKEKSLEELLEEKRETIEYISEFEGIVFKKIETGKNGLSIQVPLSNTHII